MNAADGSDAICLNSRPYMPVGEEVAAGLTAEVVVGSGVGAPLPVQPAVSATAAAVAATRGARFMPPRWPIPPTFSSRKCQMLSITEWVALIGGLSAAVVALVKVASDAAKRACQFVCVSGVFTGRG